MKIRTYMIGSLALFIAALAFASGCDQKQDEVKNVTPAAPGDIPAPADVAEPPSDADKSASGLAWKVLSPGSGTNKPNSWDSVQVHYTGWTTDGKMFDSSVKRRRPARFAIKGVIAGWTEGLQLMVKAEKRRFWIPVELAYNNRPGKPKGLLVFDVELLDIIEGPKPLPAPADVEKPPNDAKRTKSGLAYKVITKGNGKKKPRPWDQVELHFTGWTAEGEMIVSSLQRKRPSRVRATDPGVSKGWAEGIQLMVAGEKTRFWIPAELAYPRPPRPGQPAGPLVFDLEVISIIELPQPAKPPEVPADVAGPPKRAKKSKSGLAWTVLKKGSGKKKPTVTDNVKVHYSGWTTDGKMFDSSVTRGKPSSFPVNRVIAGWTEGLQLMVEGEKRRFWIPVGLAYNNQPGKPKGMLVFDVELLGFNP